MSAKAQSTLTIATLYSGGEGVGVGAQAAGLEHQWGVECDDDVAQVARDNGFNVITGDVTTIYPQAFDRPDVLHASPPCPNFSVAKVGRREMPEDIAMAEATARFIEVLEPSIFTLENVYQYRKSESWAIIADALNRCGYWYDLAHINAANFGVPQTRRRMWVRALRGRMVPHLPPPEPWRGWYEAIEDLLPTLPESQFAPWQLARLPDELKTMLVDSAGYPGDDGVTVPITRERDEPANTVVANFGRRPMRAFIVHRTDMRSMPVREDDEPMFTVMAGSFKDSHQPGMMPRAFLLGGQFGQPADGSGECRPAQNRDGVEPSPTVTAVNKGDWRAFVADNFNAGRKMTVRDADDPSSTVDAMRIAKHPRIAYADGHVVKMTVRCLARFQSFPDWYRLPDSRTLACHVIGNAVPPLLYEKIIMQLVK